MNVDVASITFFDRYLSSAELATVASGDASGVKSAIAFDYGPDDKQNWEGASVTPLSIHAVTSYAPGCPTRPVLCVAGKYGSVIGSSTEELACTDCPVGTFSRMFASTACTLCNDGSFQNTTGSTQCTSCPAGRYSMAGAEECMLCPTGTFSPGGWDNCMPCMPGSYSAAEGATMCTACPASSKQAAAGATSCSAC